MKSAILKILIEEIRIDKSGGGWDPNAYNRMHNRHNRSYHPPPAPRPPVEDSAGSPTSTSARPR